MDNDKEILGMSSGDCCTGYTKSVTGTSGSDGVIWAGQVAGSSICFDPKEFGTGYDFKAGVPSIDIYVLVGGVWKGTLTINARTTIADTNTTRFVDGEVFDDTMFIYEEGGTFYEGNLDGSPNGAQLTFTEKVCGGSPPSGECCDNQTSSLTGTSGSDGVIWAGQVAGSSICFDPKEFGTGYDFKAGVPSIDVYVLVGGVWKGTLTINARTTIADTNTTRFVDGEVFDDTTFTYKEGEDCYTADMNGVVNGAQLTFTG